LMTFSNARGNQWHYVERGKKGFSGGVGSDGLSPRAFLNSLICELARGGRAAS